MSLDTILFELTDLMHDQALKLEQGRLSPVDFHNAMARLLMEGHAAALLEGRGTRDLTDADRAVLGRVVGEQLDYLNGFTDAIESGKYTGHPDALQARATLYANSIKESYWRGHTWGVELPGYPGVGTQCITNCHCSWHLVETADEEIDAYWRLGDTDHCSTCLERASAWSPYRVR